TSFPGDMQVLPGNLSFAIFFQPGGWSKLFTVPMREITNRLYDAPLVVGACVRDLWNRLGECSSFRQRVTVVEKFLLSRVSCTPIAGRVGSAASYIFNQRGIVNLPGLAQRAGMGLRQFERRFQQETGSSPKVFARVARFQAALDAKLTSPKRAWLDIAHAFGYYDQMHMIHDFEILAHNTPTQLISVLGDVRPPALADGEM
ncbi:MAG TPA: helix-turn-helix domain-containing protein, partial [Terriglobales bacterium]|nr:helix-turn-helix domain-containing protein [Terriglobales bacterium]